LIKLYTFFEKDKEEEFRSHMETIFSVNEHIKEQLINLQVGGKLNINSKNCVIQNGDNNSVKIG